MKLVLRNTSGQTVSLFIEPDETFEDLKKRVQAEVGIALDLQDLTIKGKNITDNQRVIDYFTCPESRKIEDISELQQDVKCSVPTCENTKLLYPEKAFFMFPLEEMRCHQWALYCHRLSDVSGKHRPTLTAQSVICADHFRKDQFVKNTTTLLKRTAVPCVNPDVSLNTSDSPTTKRKSVLRTALYPAKSEITVPLSISTLESTLALLHQPNIDEKNLVFCRICATLCSNFIFIFDDVGIKLKIADKINSCLPIIIRDSDPLPKQICRPCFDKLSHCHEICELSLNAETKLRNMISDNLFSSVPVGENEMCDETDQKSVMNCEGISNLNQMPTTTPITNTNKSKPLFCCPLCTHGKMVTKSGIYKANHILPTEVYTICRSDDGKHNGILQTSDKLCDTDKYIHVTNQCATTTEGKFKDFVEQESWSAKENTLKIQDLDIDTLYNDTESIVGMEIDSIPENEAWNEIEEKIDSKITVKGEIESLVCRICGIEFSESSALLDHSEDHSDIDCCPCTVCDQWFTSKSVLSNHFIEHHLGSNFIDFLHKCEFCGTTFKSITRLESHVCGSNSGTNKCSHCDKSFRSMARLQFHQRFHNGAKPGYCELCQKTFPDELKLYKHTMYLHSQNKGHCCEECGKIFRSNSSLRYHQRSHQGEHVMKPYSCEYCGKCFIRKSMLRSHFINTHKNKSREGTCFTCKLCYEAFPSTDHAVNHMDITHIPECSGESTYSFEMHTVKRLYLCEYCEKCFTDPINLNTHREQHPPEFPYQCKICPESFSSSSLLGMHKKSHPTAEIQDYINEFTVPMWYMCEFCERCFLSNVKLSEHLTVHFGEEPYHCRFCDLKYKTNAEVQEHRLTHDQILSPVDDSYRPYECHYCPKSFSIEDALVKHIRMHTGEKPFICDQCGKGFSQSSGLYTHQKVHSDERPYNCPVCPRKFKIKGDRDVHVRKHSGDRPYKCDFCGKAFMTQHVYSQHRKIHTGERPYKCDVCGIAFRRSHVLTVHKRIHTGEKPNICDICGKRYRQKGDMLKHRRLQHGIVKVRIQKIEF